MWSDEIIKLKKLAESATTANEVLESVITPGLEDRVEDKYGELAKTHEGQLEILKRASHQDMDAVMYLYVRFLNLTARVFWKYYIGPHREYGLSKIQSGEASEVVTKALELLAGLNDPNVYAVWKASVFRDTPSVDYIKQFSYYYSRYLQNECVKLYHADNQAGISGRRPGDNISVGSYDSFESDKNADLEDESAAEEFEVSEDPFAEEIVEEDMEEIATEGGLGDQSDIKDIIRDFKNYLKNLKNKKYYIIFTLKLEGLSPKEISEETGIKRQEISELWGRMKNRWIERYPDTKDLLK